MTSIWLEEGRKAGPKQRRDEGREEGVRQAFQLLLERRFGPITADLRGKIDRLSVDETRAKMLALFDGQSLEDLGLE